ncbi:hypothetical protein FM038_019120 [Shewanella eurypsychrophilus]|uniref:Anti-sigma factor n=1 Tax=Shewanella eurypsychrophilus TaxID=2593656 RepID=A0ABX6V9C6_9GAMM|nr:MULTISPECIES: hypothetical protein [Shewanella]QFU24050.1 hypothetical protein FS418_20855 [Shewanella sp. YLB-09]QPG59259.1 hypothetical protein FM038_019120 [Shewanella eurypsychrophilus]
MKNQQQDLEHLVSHLSKELSPQQDLWHKIESRLNVPVEEAPKYSEIHNSKRTLQLLGAASAMLLAVLIGTQLPKSVLPPVEHLALITTMDDIRLAHQHQVSELKKIDQLINWQTSPYSTPVETGIEQLRQAAQMIYQTLKQNPTNRQLWQLWLWTQQREIELLRQGQKLPIKQHSQGETI